MSALTPPLRAFQHRSKGRLVGRVLKETPDPNGGSWVEIKLTRPAVRSDRLGLGARRTYFTIAPGEVVTFRKALGREVEP
jgi:hypothetical protein